jgi:hypothetical protein
MPKRIIDGEALWGSSKIASLPHWAKAEYANWLPLALANGVFECDVRSIWARVYSFNRPEVTPDQVAQILGAFEKTRLIHKFFDKNGKIWGYFIGIHKEGRLPSPSRINRKEQVCGPEPPKRFLKVYVRNASEGSGSGSGSGSGERKTAALSLDPDPEKKTAAATVTPEMKLPDGIAGLIPLPLWMDFLVVRKNKNKPTTQAAVLILTRKLLEYQAAGDDPIAVIEKSIVNCWADLFPLDKGRNENGNGNHKHLSREEQRHEASQRAIQLVTGRRSRLSEHLRSGLPGDAHTGAHRRVSELHGGSRSQNASPGIHAGDEVLDISADTGGSAEGVRGGIRERAKAETA